MAAASVSAFEVGSYFIAQYYRVLKESPEYSHQFYNDSSTMTRVDGDDTQTVTNIVDIHALLTSLNVTGVEVTKLNCQDSWSGGILLIVSGVVRSRNFSGKRKFTQAFFLAPQEKGYFVLNDILHFDDEASVSQHPVTEIPEIKVDSEVHASSPRLEQPVSNYNELEEETREYVNSIHIEDDTPVDKYSIPDEQQHEEPQPETVVEEAPVEESPPLESAIDHVSPVEETISVPLNDPAGERAKLSYASILRAAKAQSAQPVVSPPTVRQSVPPPPEQHQRAQAAAPQLNPSASSFVPETGSGVASDEGLVQEEGELTSVYVRSLPSNVTNADLEKEFKKFGKIKRNGVFIRNKKEIGVCFAFVEFEDMSGVYNAIKASPIEVLGRQAFIEERRASNISSARGGAAARGRGRGRGGGYQSDAARGRSGVRNPGRGGVANGFPQRASQ